LNHDRDSDQENDTPPVRTFRITTNGLRAARSPHILTTGGIGSCVAVTLYDPGHRIGGLAHVSQPGNPSPELDDNLHMYPAFAIEALLRSMSRLGAIRGKLEAKLVGGGNMFDPVYDLLDDVGRQNVFAVRACLQEYEIPVIGEHVFGKRGRRVFFHLTDGTVRVFAGNRREIVI